MTPPDALAEIKTLYYATTRATVERDFDRAIDLLKTLPDEESREKAAVYMDGLAQMRSEWGLKGAASRSAKRSGVTRPAPGTAGMPRR